MLASQPHWPLCPGLPYPASLPNLGPKDFFWHDLKSSPKETQESKNPHSCHININLDALVSSLFITHISLRILVQKIKGKEKKKGKENHKTGKGEKPTKTMTVLYSLVNANEVKTVDVRMETNRKMRFLQVGFPIQFTSTFQAYVLEIGRKKCLVKMLVLSHLTAWNAYGFQGNFFYISWSLKNNG